MKKHDMTEAQRAAKRRDRVVFWLLAIFLGIAGYCMWCDDHQGPKPQFCPFGCAGGVR